MALSIKTSGLTAAGTAHELNVIPYYSVLEPINRNKSSDNKNKEQLHLSTITPKSLIICIEKWLITFRVQHKIALFDL